MSQKEIEEELAQTLSEGDLIEVDTMETARRKLPAKTEIRVQAPIDPIVSETKQYRRMAKEVDERYARYDDFVE